MEWSVMFMGPVGSGKTTAIRTISDIEVVNTDELATDHIANLKSHTTVSMDVGTMHLGGKDKLRLYGSPGQDRFDFMWEILLEQSRGVLLILKHSADDPIADLEHYLSALDKINGNRVLPMVVCLSHTDKRPDRAISIYSKFFREKRNRSPEEVPPIVTMDARNKQQVRAALIAMTALLEMSERFPKAGARA